MVARGDRLLSARGDRSGFVSDKSRVGNATFVTCR